MIVRVVDHVDLQITVRLWKRGLQTPMDRLQFHTRLLDGGAWAQTAECQVTSAPGTAALELRRANRRHPEVALVRKLETLWHDADDRRRQTADQHRRPDNGGAFAKPRRPEAVAQDHDGCRSGHFVRPREIASEHGHHAEQSERVRGHGPYHQIDRPPAGLISERHAPPGRNGAHVVERSRVRAPLVKVRKRHASG